VVIAIFQRSFMTTLLPDSLSRFLALPGMVRAQLGATMLNSASVIVKLFMPLPHTELAASRARTPAVR